jgi:hypothetical protein
MRTRTKAIVAGHATEYRAPTGSTFEQRFGETLADVVRGLARGATVAAPVLAGEDWNNLNGLLSDAVTDDSGIGRTVARTTRKRTINGEVVLGPETETNLASGDR